jgi:SAM-dependent methyltransferase
MPCICNLCGNKHFRVLEDDAPFRVLQCENCSLIFVYPCPDQGELVEHYNDNYYAEWIGAQERRRIRMWSRRLEKLERFRHKGRLLDIGCGEGTFLLLAKENGWEISGTELSPYAAKYASQRLEIDIFCGELLNARYPTDSFDVVTMWHVLEHVTDPKCYLIEIRRILRSYGLLAIAVPNVNSLIMQIAYRIIKGRKMKLFSKDEKEVHLYHFSPETIQIYLNKTGFKCVKLSPDFGITEYSKRLINMVSVIPFYLTGMKIFNAIEVYCKPK